MTKQPSQAFMEKFKDKWSLEGFAQSARDHVGRTIDEGKLPDLMLDAGVAYFGAKAAGKLAGDDADWETYFAGAIAGLLSKRLALAMGGTPPVSQIAGLAGLGSIGLLNVGLGNGAKGFPLFGSPIDLIAWIERTRY